MTALPIASINGQASSVATVLLGAGPAVTVSFANGSTDGTAGYQPFVTLTLPKGVTLDPGTVTYLGHAVPTDIMTVPASASVTYAVAGKSFTLTGLQPGSSIAVFQPPYGSFTPGQTPAAMQLNIHVAADAPVGAALGVTATAGFAWGTSPTGADTPILQSGDAGDPDATLAITPSLVTVASTYFGPQNELATGPALPATYGGPGLASQERFEITSTIASGQTLANFVLSDPLPPSATVTNIQLVVGGHTYSYSVDPATGTMTQIGTGGPPVVTSATGATVPYVIWNAASNTVTADFGSVTGNGVQNGGPEIKAFFNVGLDQGLGTATLRAASTATPLVVTDMLPYGALAQSFTLTGRDGITYGYTYDPTNGIKLVSGTAAAAPTLASSLSSIGANQFFYDTANGNITANFGVPTAIGQTGTITAQWSGGQYQLPGVLTGTGNGGDLMLVDQLSGTATADTFSITTASGVASYKWDATTQMLTETGFVPAAGSVGGSGPAAIAPADAVSASGSYVYYDATNHRIVADLKGLAAGAAATISSTFSGGQTVSQTTAQNYDFSNAASATGVWSRDGSVQSVGSGADAVTAKVVTLQKSVTDADAAAGHPVQPGDHLHWSLTAQVSNYFDLADVVINDTFSDGQHFDANTPVSVTVSQPGQATQTLILQSDNAGYRLATVAQADGSTQIDFNISGALAAAGFKSDLNGGAALDDANPSTASAPTIVLTFGTVIDTAYKAPAKTDPQFVDYQVEQGDGITNKAVITGTVLDATGTRTTITAADGSGAGVRITTGSVLKTLYAVTRNGQVIWQGDANNPAKTYSGLIQSGDDVTYHLVYNLPISRAANVTLTDFLPLPVYGVDQPTGRAGTGYSFSTAGTFDLNGNDLGASTGALPADGTIEYTNGSTANQYLRSAAAPALTTNTAANGFTLDFGEVYEAPPTSPYSSTNLDLVFTTKVLDAAFGDGLQLTNQLTGFETNTAGDKTTSNSFAQMNLAAPKLKIEKAVVATTDANGVFRDASGHPITSTNGAVLLGGVTWNLGSGTPFTGTLDTAGGLATSPVSDTLTNIGAGEAMRYALVVQNTGHDSNGAFDVTLHDSPIPAGMTLVAGSVRVYDGAGTLLHFVPVNATVDTGDTALFDAGIAVTDNSGVVGRALGPNATDGSNVFVVTYDLQTIASVATPSLTLPDTATIDSFTEKDGGVNRVSTISSSDANASSAVVTATPTLTKTVVSTSGSPTGSDAHAINIGEEVTYEITVTLPGGTAANLVVADVLPSSLRLVNATVASVGSDVTTGPVTVSNGTFHFGNVAVASDARGAADQVKLLVTAVVDGSATITPGADIVNTAHLAEDKPGGGSFALDATATVDAVAPSLTLTKLVRDDSTNPTGAFANNLTVQAGDTVEYRIDLSDAAGAGAAYNATITDALAALGIGTDGLGNSNLSLIAGSVSVNGGTSSVSGATVSAGASTLAAGQTLELHFKAVVSTHTTYTSTIGNVANSTARTLASTDAAASQNAYRTLTNTSDAAVSIGKPSETKLLTAGSDLNISLPYLAVGETGTFTITANLPAGDSTDLKIVDTLPTGLAYAGYTAPALAGATATNAVPVVTRNTLDNTVTFDLGAVHSTAAGSTIALGVKTLVQSGTATTAGSQLTNTTSLLSNGVSLASASAMATIVQPQIGITKSESVAYGQAGDIVTYTLTVSDAAANSNPAFNLDVSDTIQPGLTLIQNSETITGGDASAINGFTDTASSIEVRSSKLTGTTPLVITYKAKLSDNDINGQVVSNAASVAYTTDATGGLPLTAQSNTVSVIVGLTDSVLKTLGGASSGIQVQPGTTTPGVIPNEQITFYVTGTLGHGAQNLTLSDALPVGLDYVSSSVASLGSITGSALAVGASGTYVASGTGPGVVSFGFGDVVNPGGSSASQVVVAITAKVDPADATSTSTAPDVITNVGTLVAKNPISSPYTSTNPLNATLYSPVSIAVVPAGNIQGRVFVNDACDGLYHVGDATVAGVTVKLLDVNGNTVQVTSTDGSGNYSFAAVAPNTYSEQFVLPSGLSFTEKLAGAPELSSEVNPDTGKTDSFTLTGNETAIENAGVYLNGNFAGHTPTQIGANTGVSYNTGGQVIVGTGNDNVHTNAGNNIILLGSSGSEGGDVVETSPGNDIVYACGTGGTNAQALGTSDYIFGGSGNGVLQGGSGADYLMAGPGNYVLAGGAGPSVLVSGPNSGTVTTSGGAVTNYTVGDEFRPAGGATTILFQKGDGVDLLDTFKPGHDSLTIYGYSGPQSVSRVNGHTVLWLGANDAIVFNDVYVADANGNLPGITFVPNLPATPQIVLHFDANGLPYFAAPTASANAGVTLSTLSSANAVDTLVGTGTGQRLIANNGATFTLVGGDGQDVFQGGTGSDTIFAHGTDNTVTLGDGANILVGGTARTTVTAGNGNNTIWFYGAGNVLTAGDGANIVVLSGGATGSLALGNGANVVFATGGSGDTIQAGSGNNIIVMTQGASGTLTLGNGTNAVFAYGATGDDIELGTGNNTVFAQIDASKVHSGSGSLIIYGKDNTVTLDNPASSLVSIQGANNRLTAGNGDLALFQSSGTISLGTGNHQLYLSGTGAQIAAQGSNTILGTAGGATASITGTGSQYLAFGGTGNTIAVQNGNATIFAGQGDDTVTIAGNSSNTTTLGSGDVMYAGTGRNQIYLAAAGNDRVVVAAQSTANDLFGFKAGDQLDISAVLAAAKADLTKIGNYLSASQSSADTLLRFNASGVSGGNVVTLSDLHGVTATLGQLLGSGQLKIS